MIKFSCLIAIALLLLVFSARVYSEPTPKINEFLAHPSSGNKEWAEFYNPDGLNLSTYWIDDDTDFNSDSGSTAKKSLASYNSSNSTYPYLEFDSFLNNSGDYVVLFDQSGAIVDQYQYTDDPGVDTAFGRVPDGIGAIAQLAAATKGSANSQAYTPEPSPSPSPTQSPTTTSSTTKSPSPTPKLTSTTNSQTPKSPSPIPKTSPQVLGQIDQNSQNMATPSPSPEASSPSPSPNASPSKFKVAGLLSGSGLALIGVSFILYLWYSKRLSKSGKDDEKIS